MLIVFQTGIVLNRQDTPPVNRIQQDCDMMHIHRGVLSLPFLRGMLIQTADHRVPHHLIIVVVRLKVPHRGLLLLMNQRIILQYRELGVSNQQPIVPRSVQLILIAKFITSWHKINHQCRGNNHENHLHQETGPTGALLLLAGFHVLFSFFDR